ncbi:MAG: triose-phosphate isomerase [Candidatus Spechtbacteria bacterium]|nr:triose-phosphate isomerase [Candidatus Spechtbacteria bacterium]
MNKKLIVANWKMNPVTYKEAEELFRFVEKGMRDIKNAEVVLCPPFVYLPMLARLFSKQFCAGAQNCFYEQGGAYTGEVSPLMLKDIGCKYVIVGHSERRQYFFETSEIVNKKLKAVIEAELKPILCVGEDTRDSFDSKGHWTHELDPKVKEQLVLMLNGIPKSKIGEIVIAYEPVWAIGTGKPATGDDILSAKIFIQKVISDLYGRKVSQTMRVIYGGSTDSKNAAVVMKEGQADGLLVGGASLDGEEFVRMMKCIAL